MSEAAAVAHAEALFDSGAFFRTLADRVACRTESQNAERAAELASYLSGQIAPALAQLGFVSQIHPNPEPGAPPFLIAERLEDPALPTVLFYGHGDVVRGHEGQWADGRDPWALTAAETPTGARWYGRGAADNKAQHSINIAALGAVLAARGGRLGFNAKWLVEMGEETGSPGLAAFCTAQRTALAADVLIASDGPRLRADRPTVFLGSRGVTNFELVLKARDGGHHSGNWGGLLRNPGTVLANAIASMVDARGGIRVQGLRPPPIPAAVRAALADIQVGGGPGDPAVDTGWGEPGLTPAERVFGWNALEVLAYGCGNPAQPVNAIPPAARATLQLRFVVGTEAHRIGEHVQRHLQDHGFHGITVSQPELMHATRLDPDNAWVRLAMQSLQASTGVKPALLPQPGRQPAQRCVRRHPGPAHGVGAAQLPGLQPACTERACAARPDAPGPGHDGGPAVAGGRAGRQPATPSGLIDGQRAPAQGQARQPGGQQQRGGGLGHRRRHLGGDAEAGGVELAAGQVAGPRVLEAEVAAEGQRTRHAVGQRRRQGQAIDQAAAGIEDAEADPVVVVDAAVEIVAARLDADHVTRHRAMVVGDVEAALQRLHLAGDAIDGEPAQHRIGGGAAHGETLARRVREHVDTGHGIVDPVADGEGLAVQQRPGRPEDAGVVPGSRQRAGDRDVVDGGLGGQGLQGQDGGEGGDGGRRAGLERHGRDPFWACADVLHAACPFTQQMGPPKRMHPGTQSGGACTRPNGEPARRSDRRFFGQNPEIQTKIRSGDP